VRKAFDCPRSVRIDVGQFELVLVNLAINARDAMPTGGTLTITAGLEDVQGAIARNGQVVPPGPHGVVRIGDTGAGMEPAVLAHIFEPFFTTKPRGKGTGLGLAAVAGILDRHGIAFRVDTVVGQGTTFTLYVPLVEDAPVVEAQGLGPPKPKEIPHTLLVIDDEEALRNMISRSLEQHGYRVLQADGGVAALAVLEREGPPDAVLLDLTMPGMAGAEVAQRIAARWPGLPVLFMSGHTDDDVARLLAELPGSDLLGKPFDTPSLMAKVEELLRKRRETGAAQDRPEPRTPPDAQET
jgi:two-component system cell cycle sensor histidine kinase/response regulator CckA